jgi:predicted nucleic acid-binding protein
LRIPVLSKTLFSLKNERYFCFGAANDGIRAVRFTWRYGVIRIFGAGYRRKVVSEARATAFIDLPGEMAITADPSTGSRALDDTLQWVRRFKLSSYDAANLELALREGLPPLATLDADLRQAVALVGGMAVGP